MWSFCGLQNERSILLVKSTARRAWVGVARTESGLLETCTKICPHGFVVGGGRQKSRADILGETNFVSPKMQAWLVCVKNKTTLCRNKMEY